MALTTADMWIEILAQGLCTVSFDAHSSLEEGERPHYLGFQDHVLAGIRQQDIGYRTGEAKIGRPVLRRRAASQQAALFIVSPSIVISIKIAAFFTSRCSHKIYYTRVI